MQRAIYAYEGYPAPRNIYVLQDSLSLCHLQIFGIAQIALTVPARPSTAAIRVPPALPTVASFGISSSWGAILKKLGVQRVGLQTACVELFTGADVVPKLLRRDSVIIQSSESLGQEGKGRSGSSEPNRPPTGPANRGPFPLRSASTDSRAEITATREGRDRVGTYRDSPVRQGQPC